MISHHVVFVRQSMAVTIRVKIASCSTSVIRVTAHSGRAIAPTVPLQTCRSDVKREEDTELVLRLSKLLIEAMVFAATDASMLIKLSPNIPGRSSRKLNVIGV